MDKDHFLSCFGSSVISFPDQSRVAPLSRERGIGCGAVASNDTIKSSPASALLVDGNATFVVGEAGARVWGDGVEKNEWGEVSVRVGPSALSRDSRRAFILSARWTSARIAGSGIGVRDVRREECAGDLPTFVC